MPAHLMAAFCALALPMGMESTDDLPTDEFLAVYSSPRDNGSIFWNRSLANFTVAGPVESTIRPLKTPGILEVAAGPSKKPIFACSRSDLYAVNDGLVLDKISKRERASRNRDRPDRTYTGEQQELSWVCGITLDSVRNRLVVVTLGGEGNLYEFQAGKKKWSTINSLAHIDFSGIAHNRSRDTLFGLYVHQKENRPILCQFDAEGKVRDPIEFRHPEFPKAISPWRSTTQLISLQDHLVVIVTPKRPFSDDKERQGMKIFVIDLKTKSVNKTWDELAD